MTIWIWVLAVVYFFGALFANFSTRLGLSSYLRNNPDAKVKEWATTLTSIVIWLISPVFLIYAIINLLKYLISWLLNRQN